jgi:hypothetical protein
VSEKQASNEHRWWDVYIIRYAVGIVIGAICVHYLFRHFSLDVEAVLFFDSTSEESLYSNWSVLLLLGVFGFVYTYIASAVYLVLHAVRFLYSAEGSRWYSHFPWALYAMLLFFVLAVAAFISKNASCASFFLIMGTIFLVIWQVLILNRAARRDEDAIAFYKKLYTARQHPTIDLSSYRHLREHGNAFSLVLANLFFFVLILSIEQVFGAANLWLLILWVAPAAVVYFLGHKIESGMLER